MEEFRFSGPVLWSSFKLSKVLDKTLLMMEILAIPEVSNASNRF